MNNYRKLDQLRVPELQVIRKGFFKPEYILTDGQFEYGKLSCAKGMFCRDRKIDTADGRWLIKPVGIFAKETTIIDVDKSEVIGKTNRNGWDTRINIEMNNGFTALFKKGPGFFSRQVNWTNEQLGDLVKISSCYKYGRPFKVDLNQNTTRTPVPWLLLTFVGVNIILVRQAQAAAATA